MIVAWVMFGSKLLSSFLISAIKYLRYRQRQAVVTLNIQTRFGSPRRDLFFDPSPLLFGFRPTLWEPLAWSNSPTVVFSCADK